METNNDLILYLPFDNPDEYGKAFDYSNSRADALLSDGAKLTTDAVIGKALDLNGSGECVSPIDIPFGANFTLSFYLKAQVEKIGWMLNFTGIDNYHDFWIDIQPDEWELFVFVKSDNVFIIYKNGVVVDVFEMTENPIGFSINDQYLLDSNALIDELKLFNTAKTHAEILRTQYSSQDVEYYIDGLNFKDYFVEVSDSTGVLGIPERKEVLTLDYGTYHGLVVDRKRQRYKERTITLDCFIEAQTKSQFVMRVMDFINLFTKEDTRRLKIEYSGKTLPLLYEVVCVNLADISKKWRFDDGLMVGTFQLKLIEFEPVKRVLRHIGEAGSIASLIASSNKLLNIYWGDGTFTYNVSGTNQTVTHQYENAGEYDIIITGVIEDITNFSTNCIVLWQQLM